MIPRAASGRREARRHACTGVDGNPSGYTVGRRNRRPAPPRRVASLNRSVSRRRQTRPRDSTACSNGTLWVREIPPFFCRRPPAWHRQTVFHQPCGCSRLPLRQQFSGKPLALQSPNRHAALRVASIARGRRQHEAKTRILLCLFRSHTYMTKIGSSIIRNIVTWITNTLPVWASSTILADPAYSLMPSPLQQW